VIRFPNNTTFVHTQQKPLRRFGPSHGCAVQHPERGDHRNYDQGWSEARLALETGYNGSR
jgi:hypothetical protein